MKYIKFYFFDPNMTAAVLKIPPELLDSFFRPQDKLTLKSLRLVNKAFSDITASYLYETIRFNLVEILPLNNLIQIARHEKLRKYVKHLVLQRRYGLRECPFSDVFIQITRYHYGPTGEKVWSQVGDLDIQSYGDRFDFIDDYEIDDNKLKQQARQIAKNLQFRSFGCRTCGEKVHGADNQNLPVTLHEDLLQSFDEAILAFSNLKGFSHEPAYKYDDDWAMYWRNFKFGKLLLDENFSESKEDEDVENLQLSVVLRALGWANYFNRNLKSARIDLEGPAFWTPERLKWLWQGHEHLTFRHRYHLDRRDNMKPLSQDDLTERETHLYQEQLVVIKHAFTYLQHLDIGIDVRTEDHDTVETIHSHTFEFLRHCGMLKELRLFVNSYAYDTYRNRTHSLSVKSLLDRLALAQPWPNLWLLDLGVTSDEDTIYNFLSSFADTLQILQLFRLRILPMNSPIDSLIKRLGKSLVNLEELHSNNRRYFTKSDLKQLNDGLAIGD